MKGRKEKAKRSKREREGTRKKTKVEKWKARDVNQGWKINKERKEKTKNYRKRR